VHSVTRGCDSVDTGIRKKMRCNKLELNEFSEVFKMLQENLEEFSCFHPGFIQVRIVVVVSSIS